MNPILKPLTVDHTKLIIMSKLLQKCLHAQNICLTDRNLLIVSPSFLSKQKGE